MAAKGKKGKEVARVEPEPKDVVQYDSEDYGAGFEDFGRDDMAIPFLKILQKGSPEVDEDNSDYIDGAKPGMIINSVTGKLYSKESGVLVIPVHRVHQYIEWRPRDEGGGFVASHDPDSSLVLDAKRNGTFGELETPEGNELKETFNVFVVVVGEGEEEGEYENAILPFSSTQIKAYKKWMTTCRSIIIKDPSGRRFPAPMFAHVFRVRTKFQENAKGTWHGYDISFSEGNASNSRLEPGDELFQFAKGFRDLVVSGVARADYASVEGEEAVEASPTGGGSHGDLSGDEEVF